MAIVDLLVEKYGATMKPRDVAEVLSCHASHVRSLCQSGEIPAVRIGDRWVIPTARFAAMLEGVSGE